MAWEHDMIEDAEAVATVRNGSGRGDGWDACLYRLGPHGDRYAPGGTEYVCQYSAVGSDLPDRWAFTDTLEEGKALLVRPACMGWEGGFPRLDMATGREL